ncbi:MAG: molybdopterin molybdotransferase MoeA [Candidatus Methanomethylicia archaeon]
MKLLYSLLSVGKAIDIIVSSIDLNIGVEDISLLDASGRISAGNIYAPYNLPTSNRSVVDGYAVRAEDTYGASQTNPIELEVIGKVHAGEEPIELKPHTAIEIATGAKLPLNANAVIMYEDTSRIGDKVLIYKPVAEWANISRIGEDFEINSLIVRERTVLQPWHIATLASFGFSKVRVLRKVMISIMPTGSEIREPREPTPLSTEVYESTSYLVYSYLSNYKYLDLIRINPKPDDVEIISETLRNTLRSSDIVIIIGGSSVGEMDLAPKVLEREGGRILFRGVAIRPGRTIGAGVINNKLIFMVSGYPVAALTSLDLVIVPSIRRILGINELGRLKVKAKLTRRLVNTTGYTSYVRVKVFRCGDELYVEPLRITGSGILSTLTRGNGVIIMPPEVEGYEKNSLVEVELLGPIE